ncbi:DUF2306 domain-containing protein [Parasphingopyxis lamellibrachiae]|uniref:Putative membrane protein DUF2306 n=1 Tax=Parasphingopyxis lamellibrachiae TaxID=680125 RepID=A0A3D9FH93_9SPHN|nr:DUF2306 domain-containing protein [Parasphingopyxis lamellibrachiae]RED16947.1 putative membrane protein DUF2306 [Parasphingopyxis lamellibrachiae]
MEIAGSVSARAANLHGSVRILSIAAAAWFVVTAIGQWIFVFYVTAFYGPLLFGKGLAGLDETHLPAGYVPGDLMGNLALGFHLLIAIVIIGGGPLQLIPQIRARFPAFHRYLGRTYVAMAVLTSIAGLFLVWTRGVIGGSVAHIAISLDGLLIILFAVIALRHAIARKIDKHRRWALRLFMVVSAVWFYRIGLMFWFMTTGGIGIDTETFTGPFLTFLFFGQMLVPLAILEIYLRAKDGSSSAGKFAAAGLIGIATFGMVIGIFAATMGMWLPRI